MTEPTFVPWSDGASVASRTLLSSPSSSWELMDTTTTTSSTTGGAAAATATTEEEEEGHHNPDMMMEEDKLNLRSHSNVTKITQQICEATLFATTQSLTVVCPGCEPDWNLLAVQGLFQAVAALPHLAEFKLHCVGLLQVAFPIHLLTTVLTRESDSTTNGSVGNGIQVLDLNDVVLTAATQEEVDTLAHVISHKATNLKEFRLFGCLADDLLTHNNNNGSNNNNNNNNNTAIQMDPLWAALATLQRVEIDAVDDGLLGGIQSSTVQTLAHSTTLQQFHLNGFCLDNDCLVALAEGLSNTNTHNNNHTTKFTDLSFDLYSVDHPGQGAFLLTDALQSNTTLEKLHLSISHAWNDDKFLQAMAAALSTHCTLKSLIIGTCAHIRDTTAQAFCQALASNYVLEFLQLSRYKGPYKALLQYYLKLNAQKRGYFHAHFGSNHLSRERWIREALIPVRDDVDALYYFLHMNPMMLLCHDDDDDDDDHETNRMEQDL